MLSTRREFLGVGVGLSCLSLGVAMPRMFAHAAQAALASDKNDHALVVIELAGGNDGLNTVIPFEDDLYYKNRKTLGIPKDTVVKLSDRAGLHPSLAPLGELFKQGRVAILQGVGYPDPDRSHFRSMEIWHTASTDKRPPTTGWLGRILDDLPQPAGEATLHGCALTGSLPQAFQADKSVPPVVDELDRFAGADQSQQAEAALRRSLSTTSSKAGGSAKAPGAPGALPFLRQQAAAVYRTADRLKDAKAKYKSSVEYPGGGLGDHLRQSAQLLSANLGVRVLFLSQDGYDTHSSQADSHAALLTELAGGLAAFDRDLQALGLADKVTVMVFSEFGRRVDENASAGTDHGAASCMFLCGAALKGGLFGEYPSLAKLGDGDLIFNTDFRQVYASLLDDWLGCSAPKILGKEFAKLDLFKKPS